MSTQPELDRDVQDMRHKDANVAIGRYVGRREHPMGPISKPTWNSIHRLLTGEFYYQPKEYRTSICPPRVEVRHYCLVHLANMEEGPDTFENMLYDDEGEPKGEGWAVERPLRVAEKQDLLKMLRLAEDKRPENEQ